MCNRFAFLGAAFKMALLVPSNESQGTTFDGDAFHSRHISYNSNSSHSINKTTKNDRSTQSRDYTSIMFIKLSQSHAHEVVPTWKHKLELYDYKARTKRRQKKTAKRQSKDTTMRTVCWCLVAMCYFFPLIYCCVGLRCCGIAWSLTILVRWSFGPVTR